MANDRTTIIIDADASGVAEGVRQADQSLGKLSSAVDAQDKSLNLYGEKLGKAFGPNEGLHGRLENLETPLRDTEGAMARAQMAFLEFGKEGATAADKVGAGFLLAGDSIAAFASGGVVGLAISAGVAAISLLNEAMNAEAVAAQEAEEAQKKHAEELQNLAKSAAAANETIALMNAKQRKTEKIERARAIEEEIKDARKKADDLDEQHTNLLASLKHANTLARYTRTKEAAAERLEELNAAIRHHNKLKAEYRSLQHGIIEAHKNVMSETAKNSENIITELVDMLNSTDKTTTEAVEKETKKRVQAVRKVRDVMADYAKFEKDQTMAQQEMRKEDERITKRFEDRRRQELEHERQVERDNRAFDLEEQRNAARIAEEIAREESEKKLRFNRIVFDRAEKARQENLAAEKKAADERKAMALGVAQSVTSALFEQAKAGELSAEKLLESVLASTGQQLVARGTLHLFEGIATANPATAGTGGAMIAAGLAMGATAGAISRSGEEGAVATAASTPTDTRDSRAASGSSGGEGGTTIINFNGPAYDKSGVARVITSGQRMAKHRRIVGA